DFITPENVVEMLDQNFSYVIDTIDSVRPKAALLAYCRRYAIPVITVGGAGGQIDPTRIAVLDLAKTVQDPLAASVRERLRRDFGVVKNSKGKLRIDCVSSSEPLMYPQIEGNLSRSGCTTEGSKRMDCASGFGAVTMVTATFGFIAVAHALKKMIAKATASQVLDNRPLSKP
ncbi:Dinucleotide-utilizing enzymes involved in molybdopterin and thiamine biosynthesis family 1, partial [Candidatus Regiella insecticola 5.15]